MGIYAIFAEEYKIVSKYDITNKIIAKATANFFSLHLNNLEINKEIRIA